jgi:hypothetical protein
MLKQIHYYTENFIFFIQDKIQNKDKFSFFEKQMFIIFSVLFSIFFVYNLII